MYGFGINRGSDTEMSQDWKCSSTPICCFLSSQQVRKAGSSWTVESLCGIYFTFRIAVFIKTVINVLIFSLFLFFKKTHLSLKLFTCFSIYNILMQPTVYYFCNKQNDSSLTI